MPIYNEKWPISLGEIVRSHGAIDDISMAHLLDGIDRFVSLASYMEITDIRAVATAAIREASNGQDFVDAAAARGLPVELLEGKKEAEAAALGVLCNYPNADGYVADLGGGSLELSRVRNGIVYNCLSLPLGTSKLVALDENGWAEAEQSVRDALQSVSSEIATGLNLYMVGGTWRAVAHLHQYHAGYPLSILSHYQIAPDELDELIFQCSGGQANADLEFIPEQRLPLLEPAARMMAMLNRILAPKAFISSALGIREGLLFAELGESERSEDPLLASTRFSGQRLGRRNFDGDKLFHWMQALFAESDEGGDDRLRHSACLLADCAWNIHPDYRSAHALQTGIEGNWLGVDGAGRAIIARALWSAYGDSKNDRALLSQLAARKALRRADKWGHAIRLGMRIDGGTGSILRQCRIAIEGDDLLLHLPKGDKTLRGEAVTHRLGKLAKVMGKKPVVAELI